jgi:type I restriction enzyme S subunit
MTELATMPKYEAYKDSGFQWLEAIPTHWKLKKLKYISSVYNGDSLNSSEKDRFESNNPEHTPYVSSKDINLNFSLVNYDSGLRIPDEIRQFKRAAKNSCLICIEGGSAGRKVAFIREKVCFVNKLACIETKPDVNSKFIFYSLKGGVFQKQFISSMSGLIGGVAISSLNNFALTIPPIEEQNTIVTFLDHKIYQLDDVITLKEKQIALLKERKQIIIQQAVTQGLDENVQMRDSGVDWIGKIPEHWGVLRFKNIFSQSRLPVRKEDGIVTSYRDGEVTLRSNRRMSGYTEAIIEGGYQGIRKDQLVLNSMDAFEGAIGVSDSDGKCTPEYVICNPLSDDYSPHYFAYLLREMALAKYIQVICNAVRQRAVRIRFNNLVTRFIVVPSRDEQNEIVKHIEKESKKINDAIALQQQQIEKLKEYKITLINSAVTGKIKVL